LRIFHNEPVFQMRQNEFIPVVFRRCIIRGSADYRK